MRTSLFLFLIGSCLVAFGQTYTISGTIKESGSQELLPGVSIYDTTRQNGTTSNRYGFYSLTLPQGKYKITYSFIGYDVQYLEVNLTGNIEHDIHFVKTTSSIGEVVISASKAPRESERVQMSSIDIPIKQIKDIPTFLGEKDVLKVIQLMPGVQSGSEGQSGIYVRGGGPDQNLIILDDAIVYNASHLFGFFSLFNGDALKSVELIKGGFPAQYGGRLSSVVDMSMKEGNRDHYAGEFGIGLISSRGVFEGPIPNTNGKGSFIVAGRRTYIDILAQPLIALGSDGGESFGYFFQDFNAKLNYDLGPKDRLYLSTYFGKDKFYYRWNYDGDKDKGNLGWGNRTATLRWNHKISNKAFSNTSFISSKFVLGITAESEYDDDYYYILDFSSSINDYTLKHDIDFYPNPKHTIKTGASLTYHRFSPNAIVLESSDIPTDIKHVNVTNAFENGIYISDLYHPISRLKINAGLRISHFYQGTHYLKPEPRLSAAYLITTGFSAKLSYALMNQYVHLLSNTGIGLPTDLWVPTTERVKPQQSEQYAAGLAKDFKEGNFSVTLEGYYKKMNNILGYKEGSSFLDPEVSGNEITFADWQDKVTSGKGRSSGLELFLQKKYGDFSGWIGYTLSWTWLQYDDLNNGERFWAKYDRRHDISVVGIYKINEKITMSATWVFGTGNAVSLAQSEYLSGADDPSADNPSYNGLVIKDYAGKNSYRMRNYHRLDYGIQFKKELKHGRERTWEVSVYNAYSRANPFYLVTQYYDPDDDVFTDNSTVELYQVSLFPILPSITYSLKFN